MNYITILKLFGLKLNELANKEEYSKLISKDFLNTYYNFYLSQTDNFNELEKTTTSLNENLINSTSKYVNKCLNLEKELSKANILLDTKCEETIKAERAKLTEETFKYNKSKDKLNKELLDLNNDILNEITLAKNTVEDLNDRIDTNLEPSYQNYKNYIKFYNDLSSELYSQEHSRLSKENYSKKNKSLDEEAVLLSQIEECKETIKNIKKDINAQKTSSKKETLENEIKLNDIIRSLDLDLKVELEKNSNDSEIKKNKIRSKQEEIRSKAQIENKKINDEAKEKLIRIDSSYENKINYAKRCFEEKDLETRNKIRENEKTYNKMLEEYNLTKLTLSRRDKKIKRLELKKKRSDNYLYEKLAKEEVCKLYQDILKLEAKKLEERDLAELKRKFKFELEDYNETKENQPYITELKKLDNEESFTNKVLTNELSIKINNEKSANEIKRNNINSALERYNNEQNILINKQNYTSSSYTKELDLLKKNLELEISANEKKDYLSKRYFETIGLLSIEKNKHLNSLNILKIDYAKQFNNLYLNYLINNRNLKVDKKKALNTEYYRYKDEYMTHYKNNVSSLNESTLNENNDLKNIKNVEMKIEISKRSYNLQELKKKQFQDILTSETKYFANLFTSFISLYSKYSSDYVLNILTNSPSLAFKNYLDSILTCLNDIVKLYKQNITHYISNYIIYNKMNKSRQLVDSLNYTYTQKNDSLECLIQENNKNIEKLQTINTNLDKNIVSLRITNAQLRNSKDQNNFKEQISSNENKINISRTKIRENNDKIIKLKQETDKLNNKLASSKKELDSKTNKLSILEGKDNIYSNRFTDDLNSIIREYHNFSDFCLNLSNLENLTGKLLDKNLHKINDYSEKFTLKLQKTLELYKYKINKTMIRIKTYNTSSYAIDIKQVNDQLDSDLKTREKNSEKFLLSINEINVNHKENKESIIKNYDKKYQSLKEEYTDNYDALKMELDEKVNYYYDLFNSCDELISIQKNSYLENTTKTQNDLAKAKKDNVDLKNRSLKEDLEKTESTNASLKHDNEVIKAILKNDENKRKEENKDKNNSLLEDINISKSNLKLENKTIDKDFNTLTKESKTKLKLIKSNHTKDNFNVMKKYIKDYRNIIKIKYDDIKREPTN